MPDVCVFRLVLLGAFAAMIGCNGMFSDARQATLSKEHAPLDTEVARPSEQPATTTAPSPWSDEQLEEALSSPSPTKRLGALERLAETPGAFAWSDPLAPRIVRLWADRDARVRAACLNLLVAKEYPEAVAHLLRGLDDPVLSVRKVAIEWLGHCDTPETRAALQRQFDQGGELIRAAVVSSFARLGDRRATFDAATDSSWRVRRAVAESLSLFPDADAASVAMRLVDDGNPTVREAVVASVGDWPLELSGGVWLGAMSGDSYLPRVHATERLAERWEPAKEFSVDALPPARAAVLGPLRTRFAREVAKLPDPDVSITAPAKALDEREIETLITRLAAGDHDERSRAASRLRALLRGRRVPERLAADLANVASTRFDTRICQDLLSALEADPGLEAARVAYAMIGHPNAEVRRRACVLLNHHPRPRHVPVLMPALEDPSEAVVIEALQALGGVAEQIRALDAQPPVQALDERLHPSIDIEPIESHLANMHQLIRIEAAITLARMGEASGTSALIRMAAHADERTRLRVAESMGRWPHRSYVGPLIVMLDDRQGIRMAALKSLSRVAGTPVDESPGQSTPERIRRWKQWYARGATVVTS